MLVKTNKSKITEKEGKRKKKTKTEQKKFVPEKKLGKDE